MRRALAGILVTGLVAGGVCAAERPAPREVADADVDRAINEAVRFLYGLQGANGHFRHYHRDVPRGGQTALALLALLEAGESPNLERMTKGLDALAALKTENLYVVATRAMALSQAGGKEAYRKRLRADAQWLTKGAGRYGAWGYGGPERTGDNSCSQFALLALWEADRAGLKAPPALIRQVEKTWLARQHPDGGWTYAGLGDVKTASTLTMTTAGLASLYICQDVLTTGCRTYPHQDAADAAWAYLTKHLKRDYHKNGYLAFCVQRVGMTTGRKFIGGMDWFAVAAEQLCKPNPYGRRYRGKWGPTVRAALELLFLARGRIPLTVNKLRYGEDAQWNLHARDAAHFTEYMRRNFERRMRWQIVRITDDVRRMLDAPILLVVGTDAPEFTDAQWDKLREYTLRGGTLLFVPTHGSEAFVEAVRARLEKLYAGTRAAAGDHYDLKPLPEDHPIYMSYLKLPAGAKAAPMWGVADGTRLLAVLCRRDLACRWHRRDTRAGKLDHELGVNFFMVTTGANKLRPRLRPVFLGAGDREVRYRAKVAWLKHGGNWSTQPYALDYLSRKLTAENRVAIDVTAGAAVDAEALKGEDLAWMIGSDAFELTAEELKALRAWLDDGGTLFVNAVGGSPDFNASAAAMLEKLFAGETIASGPAAFASPLMTGRCGDFRGPALKDLEATRDLRNAPGGREPALRVYVRGGRCLVVYARYGVHDTLDGHTTWGAKGYMPASARDIAANVVLYALSHRIKSTTRPAD